MTAWARHQYIYTYDPASPAAERLTDTGLAFQFERGLMGSVHVERIIQTGEFGAADLKLAPESDLGRGGLKAALGDKPAIGELYEILPKDEGISFVHAVCPGADRAWLLVGRIERFRPLELEAIGKGPRDAEAHVCSSMQFSFYSDLRLPGQEPGEARLIGPSGPQ